MSMEVKEKTEESVREGLSVVRERAVMMFKHLEELHEIMQDECTVDFENSRTDYTLDSDNPKIQEWLKQFNGSVDKLIEGTDIRKGKAGDYDLEEAIEAMTYYITLLLVQMVPFGMLRDCCIHHQTHNVGEGELDDHIESATDDLMKAVIGALQGRPGVVVRKIDLGAMARSEEEDPFKDIPELGDDDAVVVPNTGKANDA